MNSEFFGPFWGGFFWGAFLGGFFGGLFLRCASRERMAAIAATALPSGLSAAGGFI